jgi:hypothetical protein
LWNWKTSADDWKGPELEQTNAVLIVGTGRFELPIPRTPSGLSEFSAVYRQLP